MSEADGGEPMVLEKSNGVLFQRRESTSANAIVLASGRGTRFGSTEQPKHLEQLKGMPVVCWAVSALWKSQAVDKVAVVVMSEFLDATRDAMETHLGLLDSDIDYVIGDDNRMESFRNGARALIDTDAQQILAEKVFILVDANRPLFTASQVNSLISGALLYGSSCLARMTVNGVALVHQGKIIDVPDKTQYFEFLTPEALRGDLLKPALTSTPTLPRSLVEIGLSCGISSHVVEARNHNLKLTYPEDLEQLHRISGNFEVPEKIKAN